MLRVKKIYLSIYLSIYTYNIIYIYKFIRVWFNWGGSGLRGLEFMVRGFRVQAANNGFRVSAGFFGYTMARSFGGSGLRYLLFRCSFVIGGTRMVADMMKASHEL